MVTFTINIFNTLFLFLLRNKEMTFEWSSDKFKADRFTLGKIQKNKKITRIEFWFMNLENNEKFNFHFYRITNNVLNGNFYFFLLLLLLFVFVQINHQTRSVNLSWRMWEKAAFCKHELLQFKKIKLFSLLSNWREFYID